MAYDEDLAERLRAVLASEPELSERRMFGGLAFLLGGHMALAVSGQGGLMLRIPPEEGSDFVEHDGVEPMVMRGRPMAGWLLIAPDVVTDDEALTQWVAHGVRFVRGLPPKA